MPETWIQDRTAVNFLENVAISLGWMWREQPLLDRGIDGHIEICEDGKPTGKLIAVQSKGGESYFRRSRDGRLSISLELKHLSYWNNFALPVIVVGHLPSEQASYWIYIQKYLDRRPGILSLDQRTVSVPIPSNNPFNIEAKQLLLSVVDEHTERIVRHVFENRNLDISIIEQLESIAKASNIAPHRFENRVLGWILEFGAPLEKSVALLAEGKNKEARKTLEALISDTENYLANQYAWLASSFVQDEDFKVAMSFAKKSLDLNPFDFYALNIRGICYGQAGQLKNAEQDFEEVSKISPNFAAPFINRGKILLDNRRYKEAINRFDEAIKRFPEKADGHRLKADCFKHLKEFDLAKKSYRESLRLKENPDAWKGLGDLAYYEGDFVGAEQSYSKAIACDDSYFQAFFNRGKALEKLGKKSEAFHDFERALALNPEYEPARKALSRKDENVN